MKKLIIAALAATALASCTKEVTQAVDKNISVDNRSMEVYKVWTFDGPNALQEADEWNPQVGSLPSQTVWSGYNCYSGGDDGFVSLNDGIWPWEQSMQCWVPFEESVGEESWFNVRFKHINGAPLETAALQLSIFGSTHTLGGPDNTVEYGYYYSADFCADDWGWLSIPIHEYTNQTHGVLYMSTDEGGEVYDTCLITDIAITSQALMGADPTYCPPVEDPFNTLPSTYKPGNNTSNNRK